MAHLGTLGTVHLVEPVTFDYFGETLTVADTLTDLDYLDFISESSETDTSSAKGRQFIKDFARLCIAPTDFDRFWALAKKHRQNTTDVFDVLMKVLEAATARPTGQPSDSSDGQQSTAQSSEVVSSSVLDRYTGRPDLQLAVVRAAEARTA